MLHASSKKLGKNQFLVPYLMSSHPGCTLDDAIELACYIKASGHYPQQVQDFYPTPGTLSTCMFHTGLDPRTMQPIYVPKNPAEKAMQRALMQFFRPENYDTVKKALIRAGRTDLIGFSPECLIRPRPAGDNKQGRAEAASHRGGQGGKQRASGSRRSDGQRTGDNGRKPGRKK